MSTRRGEKTLPADLGGGRIRRIDGDVVRDRCFIGAIGASGLTGRH